MIRSISISVLSFIALPMIAQQGTTAPAAPKKQADEQEVSRFGYMAPAQEAYQGAFRADDAKRAADLWKKLCDARPADVGAQLNWFRSERNARLSSNNGQLRTADEVELNNIAARIGATAPGSFEQQLATYYLKFPDHTAFTALDQATSIDPKREELILPRLVEANAHGDPMALDRGCADLEEKAALAPALQDVAGDLLLSTSANSIVICNGDMDTYPTLVRQRHHAERPDVLVIDQRLLGEAEYRQRMWIGAQATGPVPLPGPAFAKALSIATRRPLFLALSLDRDWFDAFPGKLRATGIAFEVCDQCRGDIKELEQHWAAMRKTMNAGPLSRNYLLPASVLLQNYRADGDEANAARMETEVRRLGEELGATPDLYKAGVLLH